MHYFVSLRPCFLPRLFRCFSSDRASDEMHAVQVLVIYYAAVLELLIFSPNRVHQSRRVYHS